jgi:hypothetical protein
LALVKNLERLSLSHSDITNEGMSQLKNLKKLTHLNLAGTDIGDEGLAQIGEMSGLVELALSYGRFTDKGLRIGTADPCARWSLCGRAWVGLQSIAQMKSLTSLNWIIRCDDAGLAHLVTLRICLSCAWMAALSRTPASCLAGLRKLVLNLYHTLVTEKGLETLKPHCLAVTGSDSACDPARVKSSQRMRLSTYEYPSPRHGITAIIGRRITSVTSSGLLRRKH